MGWLDVADTAVKIGLGAFLGGGFSVALARLNQKHDLKKLMLERRWALLLEAQLEITAFSSVVSQLWARLRSAASSKVTATPVADKERQAIESLQEQVFGGFAALGVPRSKLLLLGEKKANEALGRLREACDTLYRTCDIDSRTCTIEALDQVQTAIVKARDALYDEVAAAYARVGAA